MSARTLTSGTEPYWDSVTFIPLASVKLSPAGIAKGFGVPSGGGASLSWAISEQEATKLANRIFISHRPYSKRQALWSGWCGWRAAEILARFSESAPALRFED